MIDKETQVKIDESGMSIKRIISKATGIWKGTKKHITYLDDLTDEEKTLFAYDGRLVNLILMKDQIDKDIVEHINQTLKEFRLKKMAEMEKALDERAVQNEGAE